MKALTSTSFQLSDNQTVYNGKVRDVYFLDSDRIAMVATDRISAFDVILPKGIPFKGQILNQIAALFLDATADIVPNWKLAVPDPMVTVGLRCQGYPVEMIVRGYLCGSAWRAYKNGVREICGVRLPEGLRENEKFPTPIITPTTKAEIGEHDEDISREEIIARGLIPADEYEQLERYSLALFARGQEMAAKRGLILVDTKYEFGKHNGQILLMDEVHTPDSSRYFYAEGYEERFRAGQPQRQLSKEFVREWLMANGFEGKDGQQVPEMTEEVIRGITDRYVELYTSITGLPSPIVAADESLSLATRIEKNLRDYLKLLDGKACAKRLRQEIAEQVQSLVNRGLRAPHLGLILVGDDPASSVYVEHKRRACEQVGMYVSVLHLPASTSQAQLLKHLHEWNADEDIDGYIVQFPLPNNLDEEQVIQNIAPNKDVDGFNPVNTGRLLAGEDCLVSATPKGVLTLMQEYGISLKGKECVLVLNRDNAVDRPLATLLSQRGSDATVTICHDQTPNLRDHTLRADVIVTALGRPRYLTADMVPEGCTIVDVGINRTASGVVGDVDFASVAPKCSFITPVPGGVGPMTIISLLQNTLQAYNQTYLAAQK